MLSSHELPSRIHSLLIYRFQFNFFHFIGIKTWSLGICLKVQLCLPDGNVQCLVLNDFYIRDAWLLHGLAFLRLLVLKRQIKGIISHITKTLISMLMPLRRFASLA